MLTHLRSYIGALYRQESPAADGAATIDPTRFGTVSMLAFASTATFVSLTLPRYVSAASGSPSHLLKDKESSDRKDLTLPRAWLIANLLAAMSFLLLGMTNSSVSATVVTGVLGVSWALTQWAPFALIGEELAKIRPQQSGHSRSSNNLDVEKLNVNSEEDNQTALILGIHNLAISAPQIVAAVGSSILFWFLEQCGVTGTDAIGWVLMFGAIPAGTAALWAFAVENED
jgi:solute carrier family 45 protein 1/2/4